MILNENEIRRALQQDAEDATREERVCSNCGEPVNIKTWPGDEGFCSAVCRSLFRIYLDSFGERP